MTAYVKKRGDGFVVILTNGIGEILDRIYVTEVQMHEDVLKTILQGIERDCQAV